MKFSYVNRQSLEDLFCDSLNEAGPVTIAGMEYLPSSVLEAVDPIAYRCLLADFCDSLGFPDADPSITIPTEYHKGGISQ